MARAKRTRRGKAVAAVVALRVIERERGERRQFGSAYREFLERYSLDDVGLEGNELSRAREKGVGRKVQL